VSHLSFSVTIELCDERKNRPVWVVRRKVRDFSFGMPEFIVIPGDKALN
jgi:hypothetical protein